MKDKKYCNVRNHCNYTGEYAGAAHSKCNLKYSVPKIMMMMMMMMMMMIHHNNSMVLLFEERPPGAGLSMPICLFFLLAIDR